MFKQIFVWANMLEIFAFDLQKNWTAGPIKLVCGAIGPFFEKKQLENNNFMQAVVLCRNICN